MLGVEPEVLARAGDGHKDALTEITNVLMDGAKRRADDQRPSMAQDIAKELRTETEFINGYVAARATEIGLPARTHARMNDAVNGWSGARSGPRPS